MKSRPDPEDGLDGSFLFYGKNSALALLHRYHCYSVFASASIFTLAHN